MYLDIDIKPTKRTLYLQGMFLSVVLVLGYLAQMIWWQFIVVIVLTVFCFYVQHSRHVPMLALSVHDVKEIWYLGMYDDDEREVWQGYLTDAKSAYKAVQLTFYVVIPFEMTHTVMIDRDSVDTSSFGRLMTLTKFF